MADDALSAKVDKLFKIDFGSGPEQRSIDKVLFVSQVPGGHKNIYTGGSSIIINSDRLILNAKTDHAFLCGREGITISSPKSIHIDSDDDVYIASQTEVYLGLPNKGKQPKDQPPTPTTKAMNTLNSDYEPVVLGLKLANLLEDFLVIMRDAVIRTPAGDGAMSTEMMYNLECLIARLPEMLSTAVFVDGWSHDSADSAPTQPDTTLETVNVVAGTAGSTTTGAADSSTGTTQQNTQAAVQTTTQQAGPTNASAQAQQQAQTQQAVQAASGPVIGNALMQAIGNSMNPDGPVGGP